MPMATFEGPVKWFKFIGEPRENKFKENAREWSLQIGVSSKDKLMLKQAKVRKGIKFDEDIGDYITLTLPEFDRKKNKLSQPKVVDTDGNDWDQTKWVGNLSKCKVEAQVESYSFTNKTGEKIEGARLVPTKVTIMEHVPYQSKKADEAPKAKLVIWEDED